MFLYTFALWNSNTVFNFHVYLVQNARQPIIANIFEVICSVFVVGLMLGGSDSLSKAERHSYKGSREYPLKGLQR
jgi:hypothetical protein